jgi:hypothetical protein
MVSHSCTIWFESSPGVIYMFVNLDTQSIMYMQTPLSVLRIVDKH